MIDPEKISMWKDDCYFGKPEASRFYDVCDAYVCLLPLAKRLLAFCDSSDGQKDDEFANLVKDARGWLYPNP